mmetsp:Transcript_13962/g.52364  ORF Transcript_13962/g.52364 Transcript_13962/m.52364 type:complete len:227 (-) Transcript_13962:686-1366(-)
MASPIAGVPASNRAGGGAYVERSMNTSCIISPPPIHGGMVSSTSEVPHKKPIPVGPHILCPDATIQSTPSCCTSIGMCGTDWHASNSTLAPCFLAISPTRRTSNSHPNTLLTCAVLTNFTLPSSSTDCSSSKSMLDLSLLRPTCLSVAPVCAHTSCHGTRFEWCSSTLTTTSSPGFRNFTPHVYATKLIASEAFLVNTISRSDFALMKFATFTLASSYASVALPLK